MWLVMSMYCVGGDTHMQPVSEREELGVQT